MNLLDQRQTVWNFDENIIDVHNQFILIAHNNVFVQVNEEWFQQLFSIVYVQKKEIAMITIRDARGRVWSDFISEDKK